jgi:tetratricopeptide (TPR) repeat protein
MWTAISAGNRAGCLDRTAVRRGAPGRRWVRAAAGMSALLGLVCAAGPLAGCGGARQLSRPAPLEREIELNRKATTAFERGHYETALAGYHEALRISRSIEHVDGVAANLLDLAAVHRVLGDAEQAALAVDEILSGGRLPFSPVQRSSAAYLGALLLADQNALTEASRLAAQARALCRESSCRNEGRIVNLQARIAFLGGDRVAALAAALEALRLNREARADEETANSLRVAADVRSALGTLAEAHAGYEEALVLDTRLGLAAKIRLDLIRLGDVAAGQGRGEDALAYYRRALDASRGAADEPGTAEAVERIRGLERSR